MTTYENRLMALLEAVRDIAHPTTHASLPPLFLFTDPVRTPDPAAIASHMPAGSGIIYRHFGHPDRVNTAQKLRVIASDRGLILLIGQDEALAQAVAAHGVHLPESDLDRAPALKVRHPEWVLTGACHSLVVAGRMSGVSAISALFASPVFASQSPSAQGKAPLGAGGLRRLIAATDRPVYGLGGIDADTLPHLTDTGVAGIGAIDAFID